MEIMIDKVLAALAPLAEKVGETAPIVWGVLIKQQYIIGIGNLIAALGFLAVACGLVGLIPRAIRFSNDNGIDHVLSVSMGLVAVVFAGLSLLGLYLGVARIINPAYYVFETLIGGIK